jgi:hypothetical protein
MEFFLLMIVIFLIGPWRLLAYNLMAARLSCLPALRRLAIKLQKMAPKRFGSSKY